MTKWHHNTNFPVEPEDTEQESLWKDLPLYRKTLGGQFVLVKKRNTNEVAIISFLILLICGAVLMLYFTSGR